MRCSERGRRQPISRPGTLPPPKSRSMSHRVSRVRSSASKLADGVGDGEEPPGLRGHRAGPQRPVATRRLVTARMGRSRTTSTDVELPPRRRRRRRRCSGTRGSRRVRRHGPADRPPGVAAAEPEPLSSGEPLVPDGDQVWFRFRADPGRLPGPPPRRPGPSASAVAAACFRARLPGDPSPAAERAPRVVAGRRQGNESQAVALEHSRVDAVDRRVPLQWLMRRSEMSALGRQSAPSNWTMRRRRGHWRSAPGRGAAAAHERLPRRSRRASPARQMPSTRRHPLNANLTTLLASCGASSVEICPANTRRHPSPASPGTSSRRKRSPGLGLHVTAARPSIRRRRARRPGATTSAADGRGRRTDWSTSAAPGVEGRPETPRRPSGLPRSRRCSLRI